jgi:hypothetical protein
MPANMPHKGLTVLDGRLDPKVWGRLPLNNILNGIDGQAIFHGYGVHALNANDPREAAGALTTDGTATPVTCTLTAGAGEDNVACIASFGKVKLAGNRFALECTLSIDTAIDGAILLGFASSRTDPLPDNVDDDSDPVVPGILVISDDSFGLFKKSGSGALFFASKVGAADAVYTDLSTTLADGVDLPVKMFADGKGNVEVHLGGVLKKKIANPGVADGYLVLAVKTQVTGLSPAMGLGSVAFAVAE